MKISSQTLGRLLIVVYFAALAVGFYLIDWSQMSLLLSLITVYVGLFAADFFSGLVHMYIDYRPLNYEKRYDWLFFYEKDRNSDEFKQREKEILADSTWFDAVVYNFKMHHRTASACLRTPYLYYFYETVVPAAILLLIAVLLSTVLDYGLVTSYLSLEFLIISLAVLHTDHIHAWVHGSRTMTWGAALVRPIQKLGRMYTMKTHARHHKGGESGFCFITGHANPLVDYICRLLLKHGVIYKSHWLGYLEPPSVGGPVDQGTSSPQP